MHLDAALEEQQHAAAQLRLVLVAQPLRHAAAMPFFDSYRRRVTSREIPVVILERTGAAQDAGQPGQPGA